MSDDNSIQSLKNLVREYRELRERHKSLEREASDLWKTVEALETEILNTLEYHQLDRFDADDAAFIRTTRTAVKMPQDPYERDRFYEFLKQKGVFEDVVSVQYQSLNRWFKDEAKAQGIENPWDLEIPGLQPTTSNYITMKVK